MSKRETPDGACRKAGTDRESGEKPMRATGPVWGRLTLVAMLLAIAPGAPHRALAADDDKALQAKALKLNEVTGEDPITGMILTLAEDKAETKKLLTTALKMAKAAPKDKPVFNVNAT